MIIQLIQKKLNKYIAKIILHNNSKNIKGILAVIVNLEKYFYI